MTAQIPREPVTPPTASSVDAHTRMPTATYTYCVGTDHWEWSEGMFRLHGFEPGQVVPTTELLLAHKHPDDLESVLSIFGDAIRDGRPFVCRHRIVDAHERVHTVVAVGRPERDPSGCVQTVRGLVADVTDAVSQETRAACDTAIRRATATRGVIDQAKGSLMTRYGLDEEQAFAVLREVSNHTNKKVHDLAAELLAALAGRSGPRHRADEVAREVERVLDPDS